MKKTFRTWRGLALAAFVFSPSLFAQQPVPDPSPGDLFVGFRATGGTGQGDSYLVRLGNDSAFLGSSPPGTLQLGAIGADLASKFGVNWSTRADLQWGIFGSRSGSGNAVVYGSRARTAAGTLTTPWPDLGLQERNATHTAIQAVTQFIGGYRGRIATVNSPVGTFQPNTADSSSYARQVGTAGTSDFGSLSGWSSIEGTFAGGPANAVLDVYRSASDGVALLGSFFLTSSGSIKFTKDGSTPPPDPDPTPQPPQITTFGPFLGYLNANTTLSVSATGDGPLTYRWTFRNRVIAGATGPSITVRVSSTTVGDYRVDITNAQGTTFGVANLSIRPPASWTPTQGTEDQTIAPGQGVTLGVENVVAAPGAVTYQWLQNGVLIRGQTSPTLNIPAFGAANVGVYSLRITTSAGPVTTESWTLTLNDPTILVYRLAGRAIRTNGPKELAGTLAGFLVVDRKNQNGAIITTSATTSGKRFTVENREDLAVHSTGPIRGSRTLIVGSVNSGDAGTEEHEIVWLTGLDALVTLGTGNTLFAPSALTGVIGTLTLDPVGIDSGSATLSLDVPSTLAARTGGESLNQAVQRIRNSLTSQGFTEQP
ncbi:MAG: hypothetical protein SFU53_11805 [Terrimicrobiaceae bacterium]|nr:hypothetical protein [Terrimicrobiaceae bacterium]